MAFKKKFYEKIVKEIHMKLSLLVFEQVKTKKKVRNFDILVKTKRDSKMCEITKNKLNKIF